MTEPMTTEQIEARGLSNVSTKELLFSILFYMAGGPQTGGDVVTQAIANKGIQNVTTKRVLFGMLQEVSLDIDTDPAAFQEPKA